MVKTTKVLSTLLVALPLLSSSAFAKKDEPKDKFAAERAECQKIIQYGQTDTVQMTVECREKKSAWMLEEQQLTFEQKGYTTARTSTKNGAFQTAESRVESVTSVKPGCQVWKKYDLSNERIVIPLSKCEEITEDNIQKKCLEEINRRNAQQGDNHVAEINTCDSYPAANQVKAG